MDVVEDLIQDSAAPALAGSTLPVRQETHHPQGRAPQLPGEFLSFKLGAEEYGIDILRVQEIRSYEQPTRIAQAPAFVKGVINLRGVIVPLVDLRLRFGLNTADYNSLTVVIVLNVARRIVGVVVDSVSDVVQLSTEQIRQTPEFNGAIDTAFITGIGSLQDRMMILMDIEALMRTRDMGLFND
jgi:purine-binding chemotaxis protein CheW